MTKNIEHAHDDGDHQQVADDGGVDDDACNDGSGLVLCFPYCSRFNTVPFGDGNRISVAIIS